MNELMNDLELALDREISVERATELDQQIKVYANMAWQNLVEACKCLKKMRDTKLYEALGYESFGEYSQESLGIKERQAYTYISTYEKNGELFLQSNARLGITKLSLLSEIPPTERQEIVDNNDIAGMSVKEVEQLVSENNAKAEQIDLLTDERDALKNDFEDAESDLQDAKDRITELERELEEERSKPHEVAVREPSAEEIEKLKADARAEFEKQASKQAKADKKELTDKLNAEKEKAVAEASEKAAKQIEEYKAKLSELDREKGEHMQKAQELEKKLAVATNPETVKFTFYFDSLRDAYEKIFDSLDTIRKTDPNMADKYAAAMRKYQGIIAERLG